jgi:uncharacterized protein
MGSAYEPVSAAARLHTLDVLRGTALLGILLMNILLFGLPEAAYANLNLWGGNDAPNLAIWALQWILYEGKMRAMFSIMFGAGIVLFMDRAIARGDSARVGDLFARRMLWLMAFGITHAWLIWHGDILYAYGFCGLLVFAARTLAPRALLSIAAASLALITVLSVVEGFDARFTRRQALDAQAAEARGETLTDEQKEFRTEWEESQKETSPSREDLQAEVDNWRGGYVSAFEERALIVKRWHFLPIYMPFIADFWGLMLIGMALFKLGVLQGDRPLGFYVRMAAIGYAIGIPVNAASAYFIVAGNFDPVTTAFANAPHQIGRVSVALAHIAFTIIVLKRGWLTWLTNRLAAVGQMALSNYILHSVICSLLFYAPGFALMGQLQRYQLYLVVVAIWIVNLVWSPWWLARYRFGPLEWCWRSLTYWRRQPMRKNAPAAAAAGV